MSEPHGMSNLQLHVMRIVYSRDWTWSLIRFSTEVILYSEVRADQLGIPYPFSFVPKIAAFDSQVFDTTAS